MMRRRTLKRRSRFSYLSGGFQPPFFNWLAAKFFLRWLEAAATEGKFIHATPSHDRRGIGEQRYRRRWRFALASVKIAHSVEQAVELAAEDTCPFIVGGAQIYSAAMALVDRLFLTRVHSEIEGDTFLPEIDWSVWELESSEKGSAEVEFTFEDFVRKNR